MKVTYATKHGKKHSDSQDCILINNQVINNYAGNLEAKLDRICIADGVGGVPGGYEASSYLLSHFAEKQGLSTGLELRDYLFELNDSLIQYASGLTNKKAMASTMTGLIVIDNKLWMFHAGNTRIYACVDGSIVQLTTDHSNYQALLSDGLINKTDENADKNVIYCCFGTGKRDYLNAIQVGELQLSAVPEYLIFTSDGIHDHVSGEEFGKALRDNLDDRNKILDLMQKAEENGTTDDCTVIIARV